MSAGIELRGLEIGQAPPRHAGMRLLVDDAPVFDRGGFCAIADAQHVGEQRARGDMIGRELDRRSSATIASS